MGQRLIDDNGVVDFVDDNGVLCFVDDLGNFTCAAAAPTTAGTGGITAVRNHGRVIVRKR